MKKIVSLLCVITLLFLCACNLSDEPENLDDHTAVKMMEDGMWNIRDESLSDCDNGDVIFKASINVFKDMEEENMLDVLDYYKKELMVEWEEVGGKVKYVGKKDTNFIAYVTFFKKETDEILNQFKYVNDEIVDYTEEEQYEFIPAYSGKYD